MNGSLIAKAAKALFQLSEEYRSSLAFRAYLDVGNSHVSTGGSPRAEEDLDNFPSKERSTTPDGDPTHLISDNHPSWRRSLRIVPGQQGNATVQLVPPVSPAAPVVTPTSTGEVLKHVAKENPGPTPPHRTAEVSSRLISGLQQYVERSNPPGTPHLPTPSAKPESFVVSETETAPEPDYSPHRPLLKTFRVTEKFSLSISSIEIESSGSKKTKSTPARQPTVYSGSSDSGESSAQASSGKNSRWIVEEPIPAPLTPQGPALPLRVSSIREEAKIPLVQFSPSPTNLFEFRNPDSTTLSSPSSSSAKSIPSSRFPLFCTPLATRSRPHYFLPIRANNPEAQADSPAVDDPLPSNIPKVVKSIEQDPLPQRQYQENQRQEKASNWGSERLLELFRPRGTSQQEPTPPFIPGPRVQELRDSQNPTLTIPLPDSSHSSRSSRSSQLSYSTRRPDSPESGENPGEEEQVTPDSPRPSETPRPPKSTPDTSPDMSGAAEGQPNPPNLTREDIQAIAMSMFTIFTQNAAVRMNTPAQGAPSKDYFKATNVGFFDPKLEESYGPGDVVQIDRNVYYRNVFMFVERIKDAMTTYEAETIRTNLSTCLRETAQIWYTEGLSDLEKQALRSLGEGADH